MISCLTFKKKLNDYIYDSISEDLKKSMEDHVQKCEICKIQYEEELNIEKAFRDAISIRNVKFNSSRDEIIKNIDKNRYSKSFSNKVFYRMRKNIITYAASAVLLFSIVSGSFYFYSLYANNTKQQTAIRSDYIPVENVLDPSTTNTAEKVTENFNGSFIEKELPLPSTTSNKEAQEVLTKIETEPLGVTPWIFGYVDSNRIIFYNHTALLAYSYNNGNPKYYSVIDLSKIDAGYTQGSVNTDFNFSPNGDYVVINNGIGENDYQNNRYNMYLYNFKKEEMKVISNENKFLLKDTWSSNSNYYAFGDKNGERIFVHDVLSDTSVTIPFNKGNINSIFISDYGDIIIESSLIIKGAPTLEKFILRKDNSYEPEEYFVPGIIIGMREDKVLYYDQDIIYELISGQSTPLKKLGAGFNIQALQKNYAVFTDGICTYVYDYNKSFYEYNASYSQDHPIEFSPDLKKFALFNDNNAKIMYSDNIDNTIEIGCFDNFSSNYTWLDNNNLIRISQKNGSNKSGDFALYKANIIPSLTKESVKSKASTQSKEQYSPGILIDSSNTKSLEKANIILANYFDNLKSEGSLASLRIKDYKIKLIKIESQTEKSLIFSVESSILPYGDYTPPIGKSKDIDGWYNNIYYCISVSIEDNVYYIDNISSTPL